MSDRRSDVWVFAGVLMAVAVAGLLMTHRGNVSRDDRIAEDNAAAAIAFENRQPGSGVSFLLGGDRGARVGIKETIGHPAALFDADGDGWLDILLGGPDRVTLFRNLGDWKFRPQPDAGFRQEGYWQGVAVGDFSGDGRPDVYLSGFGCAAFYRNEGGGRFRDVTEESGLGDVPANLWLTSAAAADVDRDGLLDLYVTAYVDLGEKTGVCDYPGGVSTACSPTAFPPARGRLYRNLGEGRFADITREFELDAAHGNGLGAAFCDLNSDGYPDLYLANDEAPCDLFVNEQGRRFVNQGVPSGTAFGSDGSPQAGMGADFADFDGDGRDDLVVSNYRHEPTSLYRQESMFVFRDAGQSSGLGAATMESVGWGIKWVDFDNDGRLDLAIANGHPLHRIHEIDPGAAAKQRFQVFRNEGKGKLAAITNLGAGLERPIAGRALCTGDIDRDGMADLLISDIEGEPLLLRNITPRDHHWLDVRLRGKGIVEGAVVVARSGETIWRRRYSTGGSYLSSSDDGVHLGLGAVSTIDQLQIEFPAGGSVVLKQVAADRSLIVNSTESARE